jgi:hypothetical protein
MITIKAYNGDYVSSSKNLRGIMRHANKAGTYVDYFNITLFRGSHSANVTINYGNGDYADFTFVSATVLFHWLARRISWYGADIWVNGYREGELNRNIKMPINY